jgi:hypothetical protein
MAYVLSVIFFSIIINVTKFFELTVARKNSSSDPVCLQLLDLNYKTFYGRNLRIFIIS